MNPRWLRSVSSFFKSKDAASSDTCIPSDLLALLGSKKASVFKLVFKSLADKGCLSEQLFQQILSTAIDMGWEQDQIEKLCIFAEYFSGNTIKAYQRIERLGLTDSDPEFFVIACTALYLDDKFEQAYELLIRRDHQSPDLLEHLEFMGFAGYIALAAGQPMNEALRYFEYAFARGVNSNAFVTNAYGVCFEAGKLEYVKSLHAIIHKHYTGDPQASFALACVELAKGFYPEGFRLAEERYNHPDAGRHLNPSLLNKKRWQGESIIGKTLWVHAEQGLGDTVMCARYFPLLRKTGAKIIYECQSAAIPLLKNEFPWLELVSIESGAVANYSFDCWIGVMSLPHVFCHAAENIPGQSAYLSVSQEATNYWQHRVNELSPRRRFRVGVAWSGNPIHRADRRRSIKFEKIFPYLQKVNGVSFFVLQTNVPDECERVAINLSDELLTLDDTGALITQMDLVITVDTSIVHIAGALGKKTWLLLPYRYEWRWGLEGETNHWYGSVAVIRQPMHEDWQTVLEDVFGSRLPKLIAQEADA